MKKNFWFIFLSVLISLSFAGCMNKPADNNTANAPANSTEQNGNNGQRQYQQPDLTGQVETIKDGVITVKVAKQPEMSARPTRDSNVSPRPNNGQGGDQNGRQGSNGWSGRGGAPLQFTGDTKSVTVTDATAISQFSRGQGRGQGQQGQQGQGQQSQLKISDVKVGDTVMIWYADKDKGTVARMNVMSPAPQGSAAPQGTAAPKGNSGQA